MFLQNPDVKQQGTEPLWVTILANIVLLSETDQPSSSSFIVSYRHNYTRQLPREHNGATCATDDSLSNHGLYQSQKTTRYISNDAAEKQDPLRVKCATFVPCFVRVAHWEKTFLPACVQRAASCHITMTAKSLQAQSINRKFIHLWVAVTGSIQESDRHTVYNRISEPRRLGTFTNFR